MLQQIWARRMDERIRMLVCFHLGVIACMRGPLAAKEHHQTQAPDAYREMVQPASPPSLQRRAWLKMERTIEMNFRHLIAIEIFELKYRGKDSLPVLS